jgi:choline transport protein
MMLCLLVTTLLCKALPHVESAVLWLHICLFVVVLVVLCVMAPEKSSSHDVWALFLNEGGYESKGLSFFVGLITPVFAFTGADGAVHMCEEIRNARRAVPWALNCKSHDIPQDTVDQGRRISHLIIMP